MWSSRLPCRCQSPALPVTSPVCANLASACEIDGRSAETSSPSHRCVSGKVKRMPEGPTRPQRSARYHSNNTRRVSRRGCEVIARSLAASEIRMLALRSMVSAICGHGRTRAANSPSSSAIRAGDSARHVFVDSSRSSDRGSDGCSRSPAPISCITHRPPTRVSAPISPSRINNPGPCPTATNHLARSHSPGSASRTRAVAVWRTATRVRKSNCCARSSSTSSRNAWSDAALGTRRPR